MTTIHVPSRTFPPSIPPTLLIGFICLLTPVLAGAEQLVAPATQVNMNEAPPPWQENSLALQVAASAPMMEQAAAGGSSVENWYRNRRKSTGNPANEPAALQAAAQQGDAKAQYKLAMQYRRNDASPASIKQSLEWQQRAAQAGYAEAQYGLGLLYANGQYVAADAQQAHDWFQKAANQGHVAARLALLSLNNGASAQAIASAPAMVETALRPPRTLTVPVVDPASYPEPVATKVSLSVPDVQPEAAPEQDTSNDSDSGSGSVDMTGIAPDVVRQSAEGGDKQAQLMLGTMYEDGLGGLPSDLRDAAYWYEQAAKQGYPKAQYNLGLLYEDGRGVTQNYNQAAYWYDKAAGAGFTEAQNNLGVLYVLGKGVKKDPKKAEKLFSDAASRGSSDAKRNLAMLGNG